MLEVLFTQDSKVEDLFCAASSGSDPACFSAIISLARVKPIQDDFQHGFAQMTDEADSSVVLAQLQDALFMECNNQRLSLCDRPFSCYRSLLKHPSWAPRQLEQVVLGILSTPADFPLFSDATAISTSRSSSGGWLQSTTALSPLCSRYACYILIQK